MLIPFRNIRYYRDKGGAGRRQMRDALRVPIPARSRSMSLKVQLEACRSEYEANAEPHVVDAVRRN